ncbi:hypothetical protein EVAR_34550_1 [Eumeta japonica]|uniref:Uncharacterized protein n=1 Tax=Eumeta variegata TaxID=151549 RepID=A0A4C1X489_EUMVA|nr:hypothetical protein EVAR_34550_1 [Eumeta japonica]
MQSQRYIILSNRHLNLRDAAGTMDTLLCKPFANSLPILILDQRNNTTISVNPKAFIGTPSRSAYYGRHSEHVGCIHRPLAASLYVPAGDDHGERND